MIDQRTYPVSTEKMLRLPTKIWDWICSIFRKKREKPIQKPKGGERGGGHTEKDNENTKSDEEHLRKDEEHAKKDEVHAKKDEVHLKSNTMRTDQNDTSNCGEKGMTKEFTYLCNLIY